MTLKDPAAGDSSLSSQKLTKVEHTAVAVSWSRWHAANTYRDKPEPGEAEGQLLYDGSFDELLCQHLTPEDRLALEDRDKSRLLHKNMMAARTVSLDDALLRAVGGPAYTPADKVVRKLKVTSGLPASRIRQVGIIGAGLDSRAWRLPWPQGVRLYEVDTGSVEGLKSHTFAHLPLRVAERHALVADLNDTQLLEQVLCGAGFKSDEPVVWLLEGLIGYLTKEAGSALLSKLKALSALGSQLLVLSQPSPDRYAEFEKAGIKPPHAIFELHHELLDRVRQSGWSAAEIVEAQKVEEIYGLDCKQAQIHALA